MLMILETYHLSGVLQIKTTNVMAAKHHLG